MKYIITLISCAYFFIFSSNAQTATVYPTNWWAGMKYNQVQLMLHADSGFIFPDKYAVQINYPGIKVLKVTRVPNKRYLFVDISIAPNTKPGKAKIDINTIVLGEGYSIPFEIKARRNGNGTAYANGATAADLMYLIMPDRFSNGDVSNDRVPGMRDQTLNRDTVFNRHGGDLKGVENHLDYLHDMGVTAIWLNPVWENDMPNRTEHGYAFTDHYKVDPRLGGNAAYQSVIDKAHAKGLKIIQDAVYNHVGLYHHLYQDMPDSNWFHRWDKFTQTNYKDQTLFDPYASKLDKKLMADGWFTKEMPDWDQSNPMVRKFLIQHALWSVEEFGIDGWRIDTYAYNDLAFMNECNAALYKEYPRISIFGETWVHGVVNQSYFCENVMNIPYKSNLQATTDFQTLFYGIQPAVNEKFGWTDGVNKLYTTLAQDLVYKNPMRQVIFLDNHDLPRFYSVVNEDTAKYKAALAWLLTARGIPQLYYGNEILMAGVTHPNDGYVRKDFPGGWPGDAENKFTANGRTDKENAIFTYIKKLGNFRKQSSAITSGKLMQFLPVEGVYVYFRYDDKQTVMCLMNTNDKPATIALERFKERTGKFSRGVDVVTGNSVTLTDSITLQPMSNWVLDLK